MTSALIHGQHNAAVFARLQAVANLPSIRRVLTHWLRKYPALDEPTKTELDVLRWLLLPTLAPVELLRYYGEDSWGVLSLFAPRKQLVFRCGLARGRVRADPLADPHQVFSQCGCLPGSRKCCTAYMYWWSPPYRVSGLPPWCYV
jgi:hypothetical protein